MKMKGPRPDSDFGRRPAPASERRPHADRVDLGTPAYMSPEQAEGRWDSVGPQSDVYSLGATLYFLLVGRPAFRIETRAILQQVIAGDFPAPKRVKPSVPAALEAICLKAMATTPRERYSGAGTGDGSRPVACRCTGLRLARADARALSRWFRRHKALVAASIALATTALIAFRSARCCSVGSNASLPRH